MAYEDILKSLKVKGTLKANTVDISTYGIETLTGSGAADLTVLTTRVKLPNFNNHLIGAVGITLAAGTEGQRKIISGYTTSGTGTIQVTPATAVGFTTAVSNASFTLTNVLSAPKALEFVYTGSGWLLLNSGTGSPAGWTLS